MASRILNSADIAAAGGVLSGDVGTITAVIAASESQTELAAIATDAANDAALAATTAAGLANTATTAANTATSNTNAAITAANTATTNTNAAIAAATTATGLANTATTAANTATSNTNAAITAANTATTNTNAAIAAATTAAGLATTATTAATAAAAEATASADAADLITAAAEAFLDNVSGQEIVTITAPRILSASDNGKLIAFNGASPGLLYADVGLPNSFQVEIMKAGTGSVFTIPGPGATIGAVADAKAITTRYVSAWLRQIADGSFVLTDGDSSSSAPSINRPLFNNSLASGLALAWFA